MYTYCQGIITITGRELRKGLRRIALRANAPFLVHGSIEARLSDCLNYCGLVGVLWFELGAGVGSAVWAALCEVVGDDAACGASGTVVMALSGFSR